MSLITEPSLVSCSHSLWTVSLAELAATQLTHPQLGARRAPRTAVFTKQTFMDCVGRRPYLVFSIKTSSVAFVLLFLFVFFYPALNIHLHYQMDGSVILEKLMNSDLSTEMADSALAVGNNNNKRYPWAFVHMNIVAKALVQNINNGGKRKTNILHTMAPSNGVSSITFVRGRASCRVCECLSWWKISRKAFKVSPPATPLCAFRLTS